jgi:P4 family phage/plasmid primase-like protien
VSLIAAHVAELQQSTIDGQVAAERGYVSIGIDSREQLLAARFPPWAAGPDESYPILFVPMHGPTGGMTGAQIKPAVAPIGPGGKPMKYASRRNAPNVLDVHPRNVDRVRDPMTQLWITEGIKKGDALTSRGLCVVTLTGVFNWRSKLGTLGDWEDIPLKGRSIVVCFDSDARSNDQVLAAMRRLGNWLTGRGAAEVTYVVVPAAVGDVPVKGVDDYFAAGGDIAGLEAVASRTVPVNSTVADPAFTDAYLAGSVADDKLEGGYLFCPGLGGWQHWDGKRWARCGTEAVIEEIRSYAVEQHHEAMTAYAADTGSARLKRKLDGWRSVLARTKLTAVEFLCRGILVADPTEFDADPDVLNVANGIVDLTTGALLPHDPDRRLTKLAPTKYVVGSEHADWKQQLESVPDDEVRDWYQFRMGQAITGYAPPDDLMVVQIGGGENGKSSLLDAVGRTLGDYFTQVSHRALLAGNDAHPTELMDFRGARLALVEETPEERRLNVTRLKQVVGTPRIKARFMRQDSMEFDATHSLFLSTQFRPEVNETDHGTWRRLASMTFPIRWRKPWEPLELPNDRYGDPGLRERMKEGADGQHEAVLAWLVAGARRWYDDAKVMPRVPRPVQAETDLWRAESDSLTAYLLERVVADLDSWITSRDLLTDFNYWLRDHGQREWSDKLLATRAQGIHSPRMEKRLVRSDTPGRSTRSGGAPVDGVNVKAWVGIKFTHG